MQVATADAIIQDVTVDNTANAAAITAGFAFTDVFVSEDYAQVPTAKTYSAAGADKISGLIVDFKHPTAVPSKTTLSLNSVAVAPLTNAVDISNAATTGIATVNYAALTGSTTRASVILSDATKVDWDNSGTIDAADAALYVPLSFNTGVATPVVGLQKASPLNLTVPATGPAYTAIFSKTTGLAATVAAQNITTIADGADPVIVASGITFSTPSSATTPLTNVGIKFSEFMELINVDPAADLREVLENVSVGSATLAALSLNSGVTPSLAAVTTLNGQSTVTINNVAATDVATLAAGVWTGKSMSVGRGITYQEVNDASYTTNLAAGTTLDDDTATGPNGEELAGGVKSSSGVVEAVPATPAAQVAVAPLPTIVWGTDTSALASASSSTNTDQIDTITVTFATGKEVKLAPAGTVFGTATALASAKTAADLAANLVVDVFGSNGIEFQVRPTTATLNTAGTAITVTVPTALIYSKLTNAGAQLQSVWIGYNTDGATNATNTNYTLISSTAGTTPSAGEIVAEGLVGSGSGTSGAGGSGAWVTADKTAAGAEPVVLPLVFTASATGGQSTLLTQNIQSNVAGAAAGSLVNAYLAYWADNPKTTTSVAATSLKSGKITSTGDKVATDLAIEFADGTGTALAALIQTELQKIKPAVTAKPGIQEAAPAGKASPFPVYVKLVRSSDTQANTKGEQNYLESRAILGTTYTLARSFRVATADTDLENTVDDNNPVYEVMLDPNTGKITGRLTGEIKITSKQAIGTDRGLRFLDANGKDSATAVLHGSSLVAAKSATNLALPASDNLNLLMGIDPLNGDFGAIQALNPFVLLVHKDSTGKYTMLTSADPYAGNYLPFAPDVLTFTTGTGGIAVRAKSPLSVTDVKSFDLPVSNNWALYGFGKPAVNAKPPAGVKPDTAFPRKFVGLDTDAGTPMSFWTNDAALAADAADIALAMTGNKVAVATELLTDDGKKTGPTLSSITDTSVVKNAVAYGWRNADGASDGATGVLGKLFVAQATGSFAPATTLPAPTLAPGWSLVTVPGTAGAAVTSLGTVVDAVIKVGAQVGFSGTTLTAAGTGSGLGNGQFTWFAVDGAMPALTAGEAVFVHAKASGAL